MSLLVRADGVRALRTALFVNRSYPGFGKQQPQHAMRQLASMPGGRQSSNWPRGVTVSTLDSESSDRGSNPREASLCTFGEYASDNECSLSCGALLRNSSGDVFTYGRQATESEATRTTDSRRDVGQGRSGSKNVGVWGRRAGNGSCKKNANHFLKWESIRGGTRTHNLLLRREAP